MTELQMRATIKNNPASNLAQAYRMGLKDKAVELSGAIEKMFPAKVRREDVS